MSSDIAFLDELILCNNSFSDANATGIYWFQPEVGQGTQADQANNTSGHTLDIGWAVTVAETTTAQNSSTQYSLWFSPNGANYSDDFSLGYDVCSLWVLNFDSVLVNTLKRGQSDYGTCLSALDQDCVNALQKQTQDYAMSLTGQPTPEPDSNLTDTSLPTVCQDIANALEMNWPHECTYFFNSTPEVESRGLSYEANGYPHGNNSDAVDNCSINFTSPDNGDATFYHINTRLLTANESSYDKQIRFIQPLLTIFLPIANGERPTTIMYAKTVVSCLRANQINPGSWAPPALGSPTPIHYGSKGLSGGAIAGIVVGVVIAVAIVAGIAIWLWRRRQSSKSRGAKRTVSESDNDMLGENKELTSPTTMAEAPQEEVKELSPDNAFVPELPGRTRAQHYEVPADTAHELEGAREVASGRTDGPRPELEADAPMSSTDQMLKNASSSQ